MICSFDIHNIDGEDYILLSDLETNNFGYKKNVRLFVMDLEECVKKE